MLHAKTRLAVLAVAGLLLLPAALAGCEEEGPAERLGEKVDEAVDEAGDKIEEGAEKLDRKTE